MIRGSLFRLQGRFPLEQVVRGSITGRGIASTSPKWKKKMPDRPPLPDESEFTESFLRGSGPGGQKINKTSCAVQLKHLPTGIVLKVQATRSRQQNRKIAREMLAAKLEELEKGKESRVVVVGLNKKRKKDSRSKKSKRKYKALEEAKKGESGEVVEDGEWEVEGGEEEEEEEEGAESVGVWEVKEIEQSKEAESQGIEKDK